MAKTLEEKIEERKKEASGKNIFTKGYDVGMYFGSLTNHWEGHLNSDEVTETRDTYEFSKDGLYVRCNTGGSVEIKYQGLTVFESNHEEIASYVPGKWESALTKLYVQANKASKEKKLEKEKRKAEQKKEEQRKKAAKFGL